MLDSERRAAVVLENSRPVRLGPIQAGHFVEPFFEVPDQPTNHFPLITTAKLDFAESVDSANRIAVDSRSMQLLEIDFAFVDNVQQRFAG
jgi:hypothetical protein